MLLTQAVTVLIALVPFGRADTEIRNFATSTQVATFKAPWPTTTLLLNRGHVHQMLAAPAQYPGKTACDTFAFGECPYEAWVCMSTPQLRSYTLRLSWPGSYPAAFAIDIYTPSELLSALNLTLPASDASLGESIQYARIVARSRGIVTPSLRGPQPSPPIPLIPIHITFERLHLGFIPHTVISTLIILACVIAGTSLFLVGPIHRFLQRIGESARHEIKDAPNAQWR